MSLPSILVYDNFYSNPLEVRNFALTQMSIHEEIGGKGYPGKRTKIFYTPELEEKFCYIFSPYFSNIQPQPGSCNGSFQITNINDTSWVHQDTRADSGNRPDKQYAAVLFLNPNPPKDTGTMFYKEIKIKDSITNEKITQKVETDYVENQFNRLVIFDSDILHSSKKYFGTNDFDSRLTQVFFFHCFY